MIAGIAATKADLTEWVYEQGLTALHLLLREDAEEIAGLKGKHEKERTHRYCQVDVERANLSRRADFLCSHRTAQVTSCQTMKARSRSSR